MTQARSLSRTEDTGEMPVPQDESDDGRPGFEYEG
jgi:hypothetical protein